MAIRQPLPYRQFINRLLILGMCIPAFPSVGEPFLVFERGAEGYFARPSGHRYTLLHREADELVPIQEIETSLRHLDLSVVLFWSITDHSKPKADPLEPPVEPPTPPSK